MAPDSPWMTAKEAATYLKCGRDFIHREIKAGRLQAARIGGHREIRTRAEWCDQWVTDQATPVLIGARRRA